jgi:phage FluMu protein Com
MNATAPRLACPHCGKAVGANPTGRWLQRFQCPHCKGVLQFDARTNHLGVAASAFFVVMMGAIVMGRADWTPWFAGAAGALWLAAMGLSHALRGIAKG